MYEESLAIFRELGDRWNAAGTLYLLGMATSFRGEHGDQAAAHAMAEESVAIFRECEDQRGLAYSLNLLGFVSLLQGHAGEARPLIEESLAIHRAQGNRQGMAYSFLTFGWYSLSQSDYGAARTMYAESLAIMLELGDRWFIAAGLEGLAIAVAAQGSVEIEHSQADTPWAARLWGTAEALRQTIGAPMRSFERAINEWGIATTRAQLGEEAFAAAWAEGRTMTPAEVLLAGTPSGTQERATMPIGISTPPAVPQPTPTAVPLPIYSAGLTGREIEVLRLVAMGLTNAQIAEQLVISLLTVKAHVRSIYSKLGVTSRSAATRYTIEHKLL